jgi:acetoin:2,6-dichlorophenolindophenol oxidoreductase subunit alpha
MTKNLITQKDIEDILKQNTKLLVISRDTIVSPLALDLIAEHGLKLSYDEKGCQDSTSAISSNVCDKTQEGPPETPSVSYNLKDFSQELVLKFYYTMLKIRLFEELVKRYREQNLITSVMVHSYMGQEAIATGVCSALLKEDYLTSTHRGHGHLIAKGASLDKMLAEMIGKVDGYCRGKGGSMHITDIGIGILGANGIVGAGLPIACGSALASKLDGDKFVTVSFFGDGASNQGTFGESLNFSKIFDLPVLFMCENNGWAVSTPASYGCRGQSIYKRGLGYGICSQRINGDDVFEVYNVCKKHIDEMRTDPHPVLIEAITHRQIGHWVGDPQKYRSASDLESLTGFDPIRVFLKKIRQRSDIPDSKLEEVEAKVADEIKHAAEFADNSPYPPASEATKDFLKE